jgi:hypothetical protein
MNDSPMKGRVGRSGTVQGHLSWDAMRGRERSVRLRGSLWKQVDGVSYPGSSIPSRRPHPVGLKWRREAWPYRCLVSTTTGENHECQATGR